MNTSKSWGAKFLDGARELAPTCRAATRLQSQALDAPLSWRSLVGLKGHLLLCVWCRRYGRQLRFLHDALQLEGEHLAECSSHKLTPAARNQLKELLRNKA